MAVTDEERIAGISAFSFTRGDDIHRTLCRYFRMGVEAKGEKWDSDCAAEVRDIVDNINKLIQNAIVVDRIEQDKITKKGSILWRIRLWMVKKLCGKDFKLVRSFSSCLPSPQG